MSPELQQYYEDNGKGKYTSTTALRNKIIEVHGEQHYKFIPFFHGTMINFLSAKTNDNNKRQWCELNGIIEVELPFNESDNQWKSRIQLENINTMISFESNGNWVT